MNWSRLTTEGNDGVGPTVFICHTRVAKEKIEKEERGRRKGEMVQGKTNGEKR